MGELAVLALCALVLNAPVDRFVTLCGDPQLLRYNSQLPLVVYVPKEVEVRYRLWRASPETQRARPG